MSNLFLIKDGKLLTPDLTFSGVEGIMKSVVMAIAKKQQIALTTCRLSIDDIDAADAVFVTNSVIGIWPINQFEKQLFTKHPMIHQLQDELNRLGFA